MIRLQPFMQAKRKLGKLLYQQICSAKFAQNLTINFSKTENN